MFLMHEWPTNMNLDINTIHFCKVTLYANDLVERKSGKDVKKASCC